MFTIKTKITIAGAGLLVLLAMACYTLFGLWQTEKEARIRMFDNVKALTQAPKFNADSSQIQVKAIIMELSEIKEAFPELKKELKAHGVKLRNVEAYQESMLGINAKFTADIQQQINGRDTSILSKYSDKWLSYIASHKNGDTTEAVNVQMDVDLQQAVHRQRKPGFWGLFKKRELVQDIWTENPYAKLKYNRTIQVK